MSNLKSDYITISYIRGLMHDSILNESTLKKKWDEETKAFNTNNPR